ncbi:MAG TPA: NmrA family NAD(P)-binding protein [Candidatus Acidoferrum sp.]|nr:NmrA family NAD(P)-binding protein [Candidatus Acidoferrum sp.]
MIKPRIIVTGATGKTGSVVVSELRKAGYPVRAMVHREDARSARLKAQGAEIAVADMSDVERVADALKDVQRGYYCPPFDPRWSRRCTRCCSIHRFISWPCGWEMTQPWVCGG